MLYVEENNNTKKVDEFYINDVIIKSVLKGYIGINGLSKIFYEKNSYNMNIPEGYTRIPYILNRGSDYPHNTQSVQNFNMTYIDTGIKGFKTVELKAEATHNGYHTQLYGGKGIHIILYFENIYFISYQHTVWPTGNYYRHGKKGSSYQIPSYIPVIGKYYKGESQLDYIHYYAKTTPIDILYSGLSTKTDHYFTEDSDENILLLGGRISEYRLSDGTLATIEPNTKLYY